MLDTMLDLKIVESENHYLPVTGGRCLLTGRACPAQTEHNGFEVREGQSPKFFVLISWSEAICLLVFCTEHYCAQSDVCTKKAF